MKKIKIITALIILTTFSVYPAQAAPKKVIWKEDYFEISKFCDGKNLVYLSKPHGYRGGNPTFFVSPNDIQCKNKGKR